MKPTCITIIGMGPRGLSLLERIAAHARSNPWPVQLNLIEPGHCGSGVHDRRGPQHLLINTVASQVTVFPAPDSVAAACNCATPSLTEWARAQGYRRFGAQFYQVDDATEGGEQISDSDHLPRHLLGRYLGWAYDAIVAVLPSHVTLTHVRQRALDMFQQPDGSFVVELDSGFTVQSDYLFLATGHSRNNLTDQESWCRKFAQDHARYNHKLAYLRHVYPLDNLDRIDKAALVGIQGIGLTAHDVIAELTVGRGGRFVSGEAGLRYEAGGHEPTLLLFSRNCMPALARGLNQKGLAGRHQAHFFTRAAVQALRERSGRERASNQLDFERELLPLLLREMGFAYCSARDGEAPDPATYTLGASEQGAIEALLFPLRGRSFDDCSAFLRFFKAHIADDLLEARRGNLASPLKAAADVLRDARAVLQEALEHGGLSAASHRKFLSVYNPAINRITFGPPMQRNLELLALIEAGVLGIAAGPNGVIRIDEERSQFALHSRFGNGALVQHLDVLLIARLDPFSPETDDTVFMRNLLKRGLVRPYYNGNFHPGGLDIDAAGHPISRAGRSCMNLWALGYLVEGVHYYTHALPRPLLAARQVQDAERCVRELYGALAERARSVVHERVSQPQPQPQPQSQPQPGMARATL